MAVYAIGDVHGCLVELRRLLERLAFDPGRDRVLFVGDLVNRGPDSLGCLRFVRNLGQRAGVVVGNHEINVLRQFFSAGSSQAEPWQGELGRVGDCDDLVDWMSRLPLVLHDKETDFFVMHAGLHPLWSMAEAVEKSAAVGRLAGGLLGAADFYSTWDRMAPLDAQGERKMVACEDQMIFTRIRLTALDGRPVWPVEARKAGMANPYGPPPVGFPYQPWYRVRRWGTGEKVVYGHWAAMGLDLNPFSKGLDSGCVYGGRLTAIRLDHPDLPVIQVDCPNHAGTAGQGGEGG